MKKLKKYNEIYAGFSPENKHTITIDIPKSIISIMETNDIDPEKYGELYKNYIDHLVGTIYGQETDQFDVWYEESLRVYRGQYIKYLEDGEPYNPDPFEIKIYER